MNCSLPYNNRIQEQTQWCWAAVATNVDAYYNPLSVWTQADLVNLELGQATCHIDGSTAPCNQPWYLDRALHRVGRLGSWNSDIATFAECDAEICGQQRPMGVRIDWQDGTGHFVLIGGLGDASDTMLTVHDPLNGTTYIKHSELVANYLGFGLWSHTYYTT